MGSHTTASLLSFLLGPRTCSTGETSGQGILAILGLFHLCESQTVSSPHPPCPQSISLSPTFPLGFPLLPVSRLLTWLLTHLSYHLTSLCLCDSSLLSLFPSQPCSALSVSLPSSLFCPFSNPISAPTLLLRPTGRGYSPYTHRIQSLKPGCWT